MKLLIIYFIAIFFIISGVENAPAIHPIHVRTIPLHPVTAQPTSALVPSEKTQWPSDTTISPSDHSGWYSSSSTESTDSTSSYITPSTTTYDPSWWNNNHSRIRLFLRIVLYVFIFCIVSKLIEKLCQSKKPKKLNKNDSPAVVENKMYVSTINGQREGPPPAYVEIHTV